MAAEGDRFNELMEHRRSLDSCKQSASRDRDRTVLTIAGGSMAISVGFLERVVPVMAQPWNVLLFMGWVCEIVAMCLILRSMQTSEASFEFEISRTDEMLRTPGHRDPAWFNPSARKTESFNKFAPAITVLGLMCMLVHAGIGLTYFSTTKEITRVKVTEHRRDSDFSKRNDGRSDTVSASSRETATNQEVTAVFPAGDLKWPISAK